MAVLWKGKGDLDMRTIRRLTLLLVLCLTLLCCGAALADVTITPVPADRIQLATEPGLMLTTQRQDGQFVITIDPEKTDWPAAITYGGTGEGGTELGARVALPTDTRVKYYACLSNVGSNPTQAQIEQQLRESLEEAESYGGSIYWEMDDEFDIQQPTVFMNYRDYSAREKLIVLQEDSQDLTVCYFDADKNLLSAETLVCKVGYTSGTRQIANVQQYKIASGDVTPNAEGRKGFTATVTDGNLVYSIDDPTLIDLSHGNYLQTRVKVPEGTAQIACYNYWGIPKDPYTPDADGYFTILTPFAHGSQLESMNVYDYSYAFMDQNGNILPRGGLLWITVVNESENRLTLHFLDDETWSPIPENRFRYAINGGSGLVKATYEDALLHISADKQGSVSEADARNLPSAQKNYQVQAPANAKSYRMGAVGGFGSFGAGSAKAMQGFLKSSLSENKSILLPVQGGQWVNALPTDYSQNVFSLFAPSQNGCKLYNVAAETQIGHAMFYVVEWFSDTQGKESLGVEWFGENAEELTLKAKTYVISSPDQVTSQLDGAAVVCRQNGLTLYAEYRAQSGENAYVIDLMLLDQDGNAVEDFRPFTKDGTLEFFIPYPQGMSVASDYTYNVTHYLDANLKSSEPALEMQCEVGGIRFKLRSLSPVELSWQSNEPAPATPTNPTVTPKPQGTPNPTVTANPQVTPNPKTPPQTGDNAHILLWCSLCLVSLAAAAALLKKHRKA